MKITYFNTLYKRNSTINVFGDITFVNGRVEFASCGHSYSIEMEYIIKIEEDK